MGSVRTHSTVGTDTGGVTGAVRDHACATLRQNTQVLGMYSSNAGAGEWLWGHTVWEPERATRSRTFRPFCAKLALSSSTLSAALGSLAEKSGSGPLASSRPTFIGYAPPPILDRPYAGASAITSASEKPAAAVPLSEFLICTARRRVVMPGLAQANAPREAM